MAGPILTTYARFHARRELLTKGYSRWQVRNAIDACDDDMVDTAAYVAGVNPPSEVTNGLTVFGDGTIINAIIEFFKSPQGQALIAALVQMLIHLIGV